MGIGLCIHIFSAIVFRLRLQGWRIKESAGKGGDLGKPVGPAAKSFRTWIEGTGPRLTGILTTEFVPCATDSYTVHIQTFKETKLFLVVAWWESTLTILHVVFGTLVFSGTLFVGMRDALSIVGRYIASVVICRIILMYELAGVRESWAALDGELVPRCDREDEVKDARGEGKRTETPKSGVVASEQASG